ncbi:MAG: hypothetical protein ABSF62_05145 [Bryobacteraceae bacterium]
MSIDERIQALTESLELLSSLHRDLEKQTAARFAEVGQFINQLAHIAAAHEHRMDRLEGQ